MFLEIVSIYSILYFIGPLYISLLLVFGYLVYITIDIYINFIINSPTYISCELEVDETDNTYYQLYSINEYNNAINSESSFLKNANMTKLFYINMKKGFYPFNKLYKKLDKYYLPYLLCEVDKLIKYISISIITFVMNISYIQKLRNKIAGIFLRFMIKNAIRTVSMMNTKKLNNRKKSTIINILNKLRVNNDINPEQMKIMLDTLIGKIN